MESENVGGTASSGFPSLTLAEWRINLAQSETAVVLMVLSKVSAPVMVHAWLEVPPATAVTLLETCDVEA